MEADIQKWAQIASKRAKKRIRQAKADDDPILVEHLKKQVQNVQPLYSVQVSLMEDHQRCLEVYKQCSMKDVAHSKCMALYNKCR
jgi:hypothetical protein